MEIIKQKYTEENPYIIKDYPYGFKKCLMRVWIESVKNKGDRYMTQTQNPKTLIWNKPKKSIYNAVMVLYFDEKKHITYLGLYPSTSKEDYKKFIDSVGDYDFNELQKEQLRILRAYIKTYENVSFKCELQPQRTEEEQKQHDREQEEAQNRINKSFNDNYQKDEGDL